MTRPQFPALRNSIIALTIYFLLAIVCTLPGSLSPAATLLGDGGDNYQHAWFLWYFAKALAGGHNPFYTSLIFYPYGANLAWSTYDPLAGLMALPLSLAAGPAVAYNISLVLQLALAAFFARLLCLRVSGDATAAAVGGALFGFSPILLAQALGHLSLVTAFPIPLYAIVLDQLLEKETGSWKDGVILGGCLLLTALANFTCTIFCLLFTLVILVADVALRGARFLKETWQSLAWGAVTFCAGFSPLLAILLAGSTSLPPSRPPEHIARFSADLLGFLVPGWSHWLLGPQIHRINLAFFMAGYDGTVFAGYSALVLGCIGFFSARGRQRRWAIRAVCAAVFFALLSLGPVVRILGKPVSPGPAALFYRLPIVRFISAPARFNVMTALCLSLLASLGLAFLLARLQHKSRRMALVALVACAIAFEYLTLPFPHSSIADQEVSPGAAAITGLGCSLPAHVRSCTVLTFPLFLWPHSQHAMWGQAMSNGRYNLIEGYVSYAPRQLWDEVFSMPIVHSLLVLQGMTPGAIDHAADRDAAPEFMRRVNLCAIVVFPSPQSDAAVEYLQDVTQQMPAKTPNCSVFDLHQETP